MYFSPYFSPYLSPYLSANLSLYLSTYFSLLEIEAFRFNLLTLEFVLTYLSTATFCRDRILVSSNYYYWLSLLRIDRFINDAPRSPLVSYLVCFSFSFRQSSIFLIFMFILSMFWTLGSIL